MPEKENFWKTPRGKAIIKLSLWGVFFGVLIIISFIGTPKITETSDNEEKEVYKFVVYDEMLKELLKNNYEFTYKINKGEEAYIYSGKTDGVNTLGIRETKDEIIKYFINEEGIYKIILNELELFPDLYKDLDVNFIDLTTLFKSLKGINYKVEKNNDVRKIIYDTIDYTLLVNTDMEKILSIEITKSDIKYVYEFSNIGKVSEVNFTT